MVVVEGDVVVVVVGGGAMMPISRAVIRETWPRVAVFPGLKVSSE